MQVSILNVCVCIRSFTSILLLEITNITSIGGQTILVLGQLTLDCFTIPSDLPVVWVAIGFKIPDSELATDPRAIIQSTEYGSRLTLTNTTVRDSRGYGCSFNQREAFADIFVTIIPGTYFIS